MIDCRRILFSGSAGIPDGILHGLPDDPVPALKPARNWQRGSRRRRSRSRRSRIGSDRYHILNGQPGDDLLHLRASQPRGGGGGGQSPCNFDPPFEQLFLEIKHPLGPKTRWVLSSPGRYTMPLVHAQDCHESLPSNPAEVDTYNVIHYNSFYALTVGQGAYVIKSFLDKGTEDLFNRVRSKEARRTCPVQIWGMARRTLEQLNAAVGLVSLP